LENQKILEELNELIEGETRSFRDYINLVMLHRKAIIIITLLILSAAIIYAVASKNIYKSVTVMKIMPPKGSILDAGIFEEFANNQNDRYIANEIELLKSYTIREYVAKAVIDSFNTDRDSSNYYLVYSHDFFNSDKPALLDEITLAEMFSRKVDIAQKSGLDYIEIAIESPSPKEAYVMASAYADVYKEYNLGENRRQVSNVTKFLEAQKQDRYHQLEGIEDSLKFYKLVAGVVQLDEQATNLISNISDFEARKNASGIDMAIAKETLVRLQNEMKKRDPSLSQYMAGKSSEPYIQMLQEQIAKLETQRDLALSNTKFASQNKTLVDEYNNQIVELKTKLDNHLSSYQSKVLSSSPEEIKELTKEIFEEEVKLQAATASYNQLSSFLKDYETKFNNLPQATLELARFERKRIALEKLYSLLEEKYQEAVINEQSIPGNVIVVDKARIPLGPSKPNRMLIIIIGLFAGIGISFGYIIVLSYFNTTIKTPEDIQKKNINILGWIPQFNGEAKESEFIVSSNPKSIPSESYRTIRTRVQFSRPGSGIKTILVTSALPQEGKTTTSVNLAGTFAFSDKKVLLVDCDLRKPRIHKVFNLDKQPGLTDYLAGSCKFDKVIRTDVAPNLDVITAGTIPHNPSEILGSDLMDKFIEAVSADYDIILLDSSPIIPVTDAELLSKKVDATILVLSAGKSEVELMQKASEMLANEKKNFIGAILNNFSYTEGPGSYYKYYYYYSHTDGEKKKVKDQDKV